MDIKVLGTGCTKCKNLENLTKEVVEENNIDATVEKIEDIVKIMSYDVMTTPAIVVDGEVILKGKLPSKDELKSLLTK